MTSRIWPARTIWPMVCLALLLGSPALHLLATPRVGAVPCEITLPVSDEEAREILATQRPFIPVNRDFFFNAASPEWTDVAPLDYPDGPVLSEQETKEALRAFLQRRFPCRDDRVLDGLEVYDHPIVRMKVPEPALRAALAALVGTLGEPAIRHILSTPVTLVHFGVYLPEGEGLPRRLGGAYHLADQTEQIVVDRRYRLLPFGALSAFVFHEAMHTGTGDDPSGLAEESVVSSLEALLYMEMLLTDPSLARLPDDLTRGNSNHLALVRLNSGPAGSDRLTLFVPDSDENVDPLATEPLTEFYEYYFRYSAPEDPDFRDRETEGSSLLQDMLTLLAEPGSSPPVDGGFDQATADFVDQNQAVLSPAELIAVACILQLDVPCDETP